MLKIASVNKPDPEIAAAAFLPLFFDFLARHCSTPVEPDNQSEAAPR